MNEGFAVPRFIDTRDRNIGSEFAAGMLVSIEYESCNFVPYRGSEWHSFTFDYRAISAHFACGGSYFHANETTTDYDDVFAFYQRISESLSVIGCTQYV